MTNTAIKAHAEALASILGQIEDLKIEATARVEVAASQGIDAKALRKVAKELVMDSAKLEKRFADEEQMDLFRAQAGLFHSKGLAETSKAETAFAAAGEVRLEKTARSFDAVAGTNIAAEYVSDKAKIRKWKARREAAE